MELLLVRLLQGGGGFVGTASFDVEEVGEVGVDQQFNLARGILSRVVPDGDVVPEARPHVPLMLDYQRTVEPAVS
ncbi:hypothetical protein D3C73_1568110 [compost metagenome]